MILTASPPSAGIFHNPSSAEISGARRDVQVQATVSGSKSNGWITVTLFSNGFSSNFAVWVDADGKALTIYKGVYPCR